VRHQLPAITSMKSARRNQIVDAAARIASVATVVAIANDCAPEYHPRSSPWRWCHGVHTHVGSVVSSLLDESFKVHYRGQSHRRR
jgi:hypothetical protein